MSLEKTLYNRLQQNQLSIERNKNKILPYGSESKTEQEVNYDEIDEKLYYNLTIFNPATTYDNTFNTQTLTADFDINRVDEVIGVPSEWQVAVQSFSLPNNIPILVQRLEGGFPIPEDALYAIVLYNRATNEGGYRVLNFNALDSEQPEGAVYDYEKIILLVNSALQELSNEVSGSGINPYTDPDSNRGVFFSRNNNTQILECYMPLLNYQLNDIGGNNMEVYFSFPLKDLLSGFSYQLATDNVLPPIPVQNPQTLDEKYYRLMPYYNVGNPLSSVSTLPYDIGASNINPLGAVFNGTYSNVAVAGGSGVGGEVEVIVVGGAIESIYFTNTGDKKYVTGDVVTISGADVGGVSPADDIELTLFITDNNYAGWLVLSEQWDCRPPASQFDKVIFRTSTIPVKNELVGEQRDVLSRQILDYSLQARVNNGFQILYQPEVLKWSDMNSNSDLRRISLNVVLQRNGVQPRASPSDPIRLEEYPLYIQPNRYFNVKLVFKRKQVYNIRTT